MEDDGGGGEGAGEAKVAPTTSGFGSEVEISESMFREIELFEAVYGTPKGNIWRDEKLVYSSFYRDHLDDTGKDEFLKVEIIQLDYFCSKHDPSWSSKMLADAVSFFKLHKTWQVYICPRCECFSWFSDSDSLVLHLMNEHDIVLPFLRQNSIEEHQCAEALRRTVWKPIDISLARNTLCTKYSHLDTDRLGSLEWPLSAHYGRCKCLAQLQKGFELLLKPREGDSFSGCLRALIAVAAEDTLRHLDPMNILPLPFRALLYGSPLSFRFMEEDSLGHFVSLVEGICNLHQASQNRELEGTEDDDVNWSKSECPDAVSLSADCDYFVIDDAKLKLCGADGKDMGLWLVKAPYFPTMKKLPTTKASEILKQAEKKAASFSECLKNVLVQSDLKLLTSCLKIWNMGHCSMPLLDTSFPELASNSESNAGNVKDMLAPSCYSFRDPAERPRIEFFSQHYLQLMKLTWELQFFEFQFRQLCSVDLRVYILHLLRSFLRMKLYLFIRIQEVPAPPGDVEGEHANEGNLIEVSREEHGSDTTIPDVISQRCEELSTTAQEPGNSGSDVIGVSDVHPTMIDCSEALEGETTGASAGCTDGCASQVASADAALSRSSIAEFVPRFKAMPESDAEPQSQWSQEVQDPLYFDFDMYSDPDSLSQSEGEFRDVCSKTKEYPVTKEFSTIVWLMREKYDWQNKENVLFVCMTMNDVMRHCLEKFNLQTAHNIWGWKTNRTRKNWRCFECGKRFPDQKSHMLHLGLSWDQDWLVPSQVQQEGQSGLNEGVKERTDSLDDSITVDCIYRRFIVEMEEFRSSYQNEEEGSVNQFGQIVGQIRHQICSLVNMFDTKSKLCLTSEIGELDAEIVQKYAELKMSKQNLSNLCVSDYKNEILPSIHSYLQERMDSGFRSWALETLNNLLGDIGCPCFGLPDSFSVKLASLGKVIINIGEYNEGITFAYVGMRWKFAGEVSSKESTEIMGTYMFSGISNSDDCMECHSTVILHEDTKMTMKWVYIRNTLERQLERDLTDKLLRFQAECRGKIRV